MKDSLVSCGCWGLNIGLVLSPAAIQTGQPFKIKEPLSLRSNKGLNEEKPWFLRELLLKTPSYGVPETFKKPWELAAKKLVGG